MKTKEYKLKKYLELSERLEQAGFKFEKTSRAKYVGCWRKSLGSKLFFEIHTTHSYCNEQLPCVECCDLIFHGGRYPLVYIKEYSSPEKILKAALISKIG
jgi:hypothetical protein